MTLPYAEEMNYWKTGHTGAATWLEKSASLLEQHGANVRLSAKGQQDGRSAYMIEFSCGPDTFRSIWAVLPTKGNTSKARDAERQAATMLYHDIKSRMLRLAIYGPRAAFFEFLLLPDGRAVGQLASDELTSACKSLPPPANV